MTLPAHLFLFSVQCLEISSCFLWSDRKLQRPPVDNFGSRVRCYNTGSGTQILFFKTNIYAWSCKKKSRGRECFESAELMNAQSLLKGFQMFWNAPVDTEMLRLTTARCCNATSRSNKQAWRRCLAKHVPLTCEQVDNVCKRLAFVFNETISARVLSPKNDKVFGFFYIIIFIVFIFFFFFSRIEYDVWAAIHFSVLRIEAVWCGVSVWMRWPSRINNSDRPETTELVSSPDKKIYKNKNK